MAARPGRHATALFESLSALFPRDEPKLLLPGNKIVFRHVPVKLLYPLENVFGPFEDSSALFQEHIGQLADAFTRPLFGHRFVDQVISAALRPSNSLPVMM